METLQIEYRHLYVNDFSHSGGPVHSIGYESKPVVGNDGLIWHFITYKVDGEERQLSRRSKNYVTLEELVLAHENYLEFYKTLDPEDGTDKNTLIQYDSVYRIIDNGNGRGSISRL